ncbi:PRK06851 family protein [Paenibacillus sp. IHBB 10380]|uniref:PRK06851 family protein n=1 Tax=Paenibacillus sp. IHBB 10380 TaxID=1566358 RepID=UPI0005CFE8D9|nr:PRK06851 family protein [Paenibacillus sp. IHBB 10380]AJS61332.1 hypothetical protein UB51_00620 [Paenibacillus sp. IHBB 10380]
MNGNIKNFYAGGNTAHGFASLMDSSLQELERLFIVKGESRTGKSEFIRTIGDHMVSNGYDTWFIHCAADNGSLDGIVVPFLKVGIIVGRAPYVMESTLPDIAIQYVNLSEACDTTQLIIHELEIEHLNEQISQAYQQAYSGFAEALRIHDEWEALYIANMDFQEADVLTKEYIDALYGDRKLEKQSRVDHRFLGAATPKGAVDFVPNLTEGLKRYLIKGRPGSGKSTMLKKLAAAGIERGFDVEIYHCGFDPNSLDMIIVRDLQFAIFDSTAPHEYFPDRETDEIVDMYTRCIIPGTDEEHAEAVIHIRERYAAQMKQSMQYLAQVKSLQDELEAIYGQSMDFSLVDRMRDEVQQEFTHIAAIAD